MKQENYPEKIWVQSYFSDDTTIGIYADEEDYHYDENIPYIREDIITTIKNQEIKYILVEWPESQFFMGKDGVFFAEGTQNLFVPEKFIENN